MRHRRPRRRARRHSGPDHPHHARDRSFLRHRQRQRRGRDGRPSSVVLGRHPASIRNHRGHGPGNIRQHPRRSGSRRRRPRGWPYRGDPGGHAASRRRPIPWTCGGWKVRFDRRSPTGGCSDPGWARADRGCRRPGPRGGRPPDRAGPCGRGSGVARPRSTLGSRSSSRRSWLPSSGRPHCTTRPREDCLPASTKWPWPRAFESGPISAPCCGSGPDGNFAPRWGPILWRRLPQGLCWLPSRPIEPIRFSGRSLSMVTRLPGSARPNLARVCAIRRANRCRGPVATKWPECCRAGPRDRGSPCPHPPFQPSRRSFAIEPAGRARVTPRRRGLLDRYLAARYLDWDDEHGRHR